MHFYRLSALQKSVASFTHSRRAYLHVLPNRQTAKRCNDIKAMSMSVFAKVFQLIALQS